MELTEGEKGKTMYDLNNNRQQASHELNISKSMGKLKEYQERSNYYKALDGYITMKMKVQEVNNEILKAKQETERFQVLLHKTLEENFELKSKLKSLEKLNL